MAPNHNDTQKKKQRAMIKEARILQNNGLFLYTTRVLKIQKAHRKNNLRT
jgi:hypothetical protein